MDQSPAGFTLVELLITITIIGMLATLVMGALSYARVIAREAATKATIAKLHNIIMEKYESYQTRRVRINYTNMILPPGKRRLTAIAEIRLAALRDLMRMEMPERWNDVTDAPAPLPYGVPAMQRPALAISYGQQYQAAVDAYTANTVGQHSHAKCLYMIVAGNPENLEQFNRSEIGIPDGDGLPVFVDGWGNPIYFLRWAPAFSYGAPYNAPSDIQSGDQQNDHDPFDMRKVDAGTYKLIPLIYSAGRDGEYGINVGGTAATPLHYYDISQDVNNYWRICTRTDYQNNGAPAIDDDSTDHNLGHHLDNIHNHHIEQR